jgi:predicted ATPase
MASQQLKRIRIAGFRSLKEVELELTPVTVLIGPNGAGKSNVLWALEMVRMLAFEGLQLFVSERGGATYLMHYGPKQTVAIELSLEFETEAGALAYEAKLGYGADESLVFLSERTGLRTVEADPWQWTSLGAGHRESNLKTVGDPAAVQVRALLRQIHFYHFHDTSRRSPLRTLSYADAGGDYLRSDGSNLPAFLLALRDSTEPASQASWKRIEGTLRRITPFISSLNPVEDRLSIRLEWHDDQGAVFGPAHLSDGTLRALALVAALAQPDREMPLVSCIDEPELGLHPAALDILCSLISSVSAHRQILVSTQSPIVLDHCEPSQIVVAERVNGSTHVTRVPRPGSRCERKHVASA